MRQSNGSLPLVVALVLALGGCRTRPSEPRAVAGVIDLSSWSFADSGSARLTGEWTVRWHELAGAAPLERPAPPPFLHVPGTWDSLRIAGQALPDLGFATHTLRVILPQGPLPELALSLAEGHSAERWWLDGQPLVERGRVSRTRAEEQAAPAPRLVRFTPKGPTIDLAVEVSNHFHFEGGLVHTPRIGTAAALEAEAQRDANLDFLVIGCLGIVSLYYAALCLSRPEPSHLLFAAVSFVVTLRVATLQWRLPALLPLDAAAQLRLDYLTLYLAPAGYFAFVAALFPGDVPRGATRASAAFALAGVASVLGLPTAAFTRLRIVAIAVAIAATCAALAFVVRAARRGREGALLIAASCLIVVLVAVHDALNRMRLIPETRDLLPVAYAAMLFPHAVVLGRRLSSALSDSERMGASLRDLNASLEQRIAERTAELERLATTDPLTGLFNRRHLLRLAEAERARARRHGYPLAVMVLDLDEFKRVNDTHGHEGGDAALGQLTARLATLVRGHDVMGRWGGEEFVVVLPHLDRDAAGKAGERFREALAVHPIVLPDGGTLSLTVSIGVAVAREGESFEEAIRRADQALYAAKAAGRNRVVLAGG